MSARTSGVVRMSFRPSVFQSVPSSVRLSAVVCPHELPGLSVCPSVRLSSSWYLRPFVCHSSCRVDYSIIINWTSPFPMLGVSGVLFYFHSISNSNSCYQTVKTLIRRRVLRRLIWVCTVCLCPKTEFNNLRKIICLRKIVSLTFQN